MENIRVCSYVYSLEFCILNYFLNKLKCFDSIVSPITNDYCISKANSKHKLSIIMYIELYIHTSTEH